MHACDDMAQWVVVRAFGRRWQNPARSGVIIPDKLFIGFANNLLAIIWISYGRSLKQNRKHRGFEIL